MAGNYGPREIAQEANTLANKSFHNHKYVLAIELDGSKAAYWENRAFACFKIEEYAKAIQDATKAIQVDRNYYKDYYGRGLEYFAIRRFQEAMDDFKQVALKLRNCERETIRHKLDGAVILPNLTRDATKKLMKLRLQGAVSMLESRRA